MNAQETVQVILALSEAYAKVMAANPRLGDYSLSEIIDATGRLAKTIAPKENA